jgi:hypothetical protein
MAFPAPGAREQRLRYIPTLIGCPCTRRINITAENLNAKLDCSYRDRLHQTVLENLGWRIHRIWSTDWFLNLARCMQDLEAAIMAAKQAAANRP